MAVTVPDWADTLLDLVGVNWPNVDEDAYRDMADALREFADDLADDGHLANLHVQRLLSSGHGEAMDALNRHWTNVKDKHLNDMVSAARTIAGALDLAAGAIEGMKWKAVGELGVLAGQTGLAMALIPVTGGLSALLGAGAIAFTKKQLLRLITQALEEAVGHIVSVMTEPVVAALENMAADLVVQVSMDALGVQNGVNLDQTKQVGKDGLNLASAGGGGGEGKGFHIEHAEHDKAGTRLNGVSLGIHGRTTGKLSKAKGHQRRNKGRDDIANALDPVIEKAMGALVKSAKTMGDHIGETLPQAVNQISKNHKNTDADIRDRLLRQRTGDHDDAKDGPGKSRTGDRPDAGDIRTRPNALRSARGDAQRNSIPLDKTHCEGDPIDVATGEMILTQTDLDLPGVLPLTLRRVHLSQYRYGQWFGRSWASTLDERLEIDPMRGGLIWAREDGSLLVYPRVPAAGDDPVLPVEGPRMALSHSAAANARTTYCVTDPDTGICRYFTGDPYAVSTAYWLSEIEDRNGNGITIARRTDGSPSAITHDGGYQVQLTTDGSRITGLSLRAPTGPVTVLSYGYDEHGNLALVTNSSGLPSRFAYDEDARITSWTDRNDSTFRYVYDSADRVVETVGPDGIMSATLSYDHADEPDRTTRYTDSTGATTAFRFDARYRLVAWTDALGHTSTTAYDELDRVVSASDPLGATVRITYNDEGRPTSVLRADGRITSVSYNAFGLPATVTEPNGATWHHEYDEHGNRTVLTDPAGARTTYTYDGQGAITGVTDPVGNVVTIDRNPAGLATALTDPTGAVTRCAYDAFGRPAEVTDPLGGVTRLTWSVEGSLTSRTSSVGATERWAYDGEGNCARYTDPSGRTTVYTYTHFDLPTEIRNPDGARIRFRHDTERRLVATTDAHGLAWGYTYDAAGRLIAETDYDGSTTSYAYDAAGMLTGRTNALGQTTSYRYDSVGNLVEKDIAGYRVDYAHDADGRLLRAESPESVLEYSYDAVGRVIAESIDGRTVATTCDAVGRRLTRTTPSGTVTRQSYGEAGHRNSLTVAGRTLRFTHDAVGRETTRALEDVFRLAHTWNPVGRLEAQVLTPLTPPAPEPADSAAAADRCRERRYSWDQDGRLLAVTGSRATRRSFSLDSAGRVTTAEGPGWQESYAYDEAGNQRQASWPSGMPGTEAIGGRRYEGSRLVGAGAVRYEYDSQGRVVLRQKSRISRKPDTWRYVWDAEDRLTAVTTPDGTRWRYRYDPLGRRVAKERLSPDGASIVEETLFSWDGSTLVEQSTRGPGTETVHLTWEHDGYRPLLQVETKSAAHAPQHNVDQRFFAIVTDLVGTPTEMIDETGHIAWHSRSTVWGITVWNRDATAYTPLRFPGQYYDPETGLHHNYFRHYDPETARYLTLDPLGLDAGPNPFAYVDNPFTLQDPLGLKPCDETDPTWGGRVRFSTGPGGRSGTMRARIEPGMTGGKTKPPTNVVGYQKYKGWNKTHLLGAQIGGSNKDPRNFVAMHRNANSPVMKAIEDQIRHAVDKNNETINYTVTPIYRTNDPTDLVPIGLTIHATGNKGFQFTPYEGSSPTNHITIMNVPKP
jgi:RHS repeat-associated protein